MPRPALLESERLVKTAVQLSREQYDVLTAMAEERQLSVAAIVREAVREYLTSLQRLVA